LSWSKVSFKFLYFRLFIRYVFDVCSWWDRFNSRWATLYWSRWSSFCCFHQFESHYFHFFFSDNQFENDSTRSWRLRATKERFELLAMCEKCDRLLTSQWRDVQLLHVSKEQMRIREWFVLCSSFESNMSRFLVNFVESRISWWEWDVEYESEICLKNPWIVKLLVSCRSLRCESDWWSKCDRRSVMQSWSILFWISYETFRNRFEFLLIFFFFEYASLILRKLIEILFRTTISFFSSRTITMRMLIWMFKNFVLSDWIWCFD
jgi:hypothetical protein